MKEIFYDSYDSRIKGEENWKKEKNYKESPKGNWRVHKKRKLSTRIVGRVFWRVFLEDEASEGLQFNNYEKINGNTKAFKILLFRFDPKRGRGRIFACPKSIDFQKIVHALLCTNQFNVINATY